MEFGPRPKIDVGGRFLAKLESTSKKTGVFVNRLLDRAIHAALDAAGDHGWERRLESDDLIAYRHHCDRPARRSGRNSVMVSEETFKWAHREAAAAGLSTGDLFDRFINGQLDLAESPTTTTQDQER